MKRIFKDVYLEALTKFREIRHAMNSRPARTENSSVFDDIHENNTWKSTLSVSGPGSELAETEEVRSLIPHLLSSLNIQSLLDVPCGDFSWMREVNFGNTSYIGGDVVKHLIESNTALYGNDRRQFRVLNLIKDQLPAADLIFCRDCLIHLSFDDAIAALDNIRASGATYLLITTDPSVRANRPIHSGEYRAINLELPPFRLKHPLAIYRDRRKTQKGERLIDPHKSLALYQLS